MEITEKNIMNLRKLCHACLSTDTEVEDLTESNADYEHFMNIYKTCTNLVLIEFDTFSLCQSCIRRLQEFYNFQQLCLQSHATIRATKTKADQIVLCEEKDVCVFNNITSEEIKIECDSEENSVSQNFKCTICCEFFETFNSLCKHKKVVHCTKDYKCNLCEETFSRPLLLTEHVKIHKSGNFGEVKIFGCGRCEKSYTSMLNLKFHIYSHLGLRPHKCRFCPKDFYRVTALNTHLKVHAGVRNFLCSECGKDFSSAPLLKRHQITHSGSRIQCELCPSSFATPYELTVHKRIHTGEKPYLCSTCGKVFRRVNHLNVHKRIHTGERPYKCSFCGRSFVQKGDWKAHERIHTGEKPYSCKICHKNFIQSSALTSHLKKHEEKGLICEFCCKVFVKLGCLQKHLLLHRGASVNRKEPNLSSHVS